MHQQARNVVFRWLALSGLLTFELLALTFRYDCATLVGRANWWAEALLLAPQILRFAVAVAGATALFAGPAIWKEVSRTSPAGHPARRCLYLLAHLIAFVCFERACAIVFGGQLQDLGSPGLYAAAWLILGAATLVFYGLAILPGSFLLALAARTRWSLLTGLAVGALAYAGCFLSAALWRPLGDATLIVVSNLVGLWEPTAYCLIEDRIIGTDRFAVEIAKHCSGYEGIGLVTVLLAAYLGLNRSRFRFPQAILLLPLGAATIWFANALRIALLVSIGSRWSPEVALGGFHSQAGWIAFNAVALGLVFLAQRLPFFARQPEGSYTASPSAAYLLPFMTVMAVAMVTAAFSAGFDRLYPLRVVAVAGVLWYFRRVYRPEIRPPALGAVIVGICVFVLWVALGQLRGPSQDTNATSAVGGLSHEWAIGWIVFRVIGSVLTVPIAEELAFRGYLLRRLGGENWDTAVPSFAPVPFLASSLLFGVLHDHWLAGTLAGMCYAGIYYRRGRLADPIVAHAVTNFLLVITVAISGDWSWWS